MVKVCYLCCIVFDYMEALNSEGHTVRSCGWGIEEFGNKTFLAMYWKKNSETRLEKLFRALFYYENKC